MLILSRLRKDGDGVQSCQSYLIGDLNGSGRISTSTFLYGSCLDDGQYHLRTITPNSTAMSSMRKQPQSRPLPVLAPQYINGVYIPALLLVVGTAIVRLQWLPYAAALATVLGGWKIYSNRSQFRLTWIYKYANRARQSLAHF